MCPLLRARADRMAINITLNSFNTKLNAENRDIRNSLYPAVGELYPAGTELLCRVDDDAKLVAALSSFGAYRAMFEKFQNTSAEDFSIDDEFYKHEVMLYELSFEVQMNFGVFFAYVKLKEQEIANITWLAELITLQVSRALPGWNKYVVPFKYHDDELKKIAE
jgi:V-type H+-transporting ATPase subunit d